MRTRSWMLGAFVLLGTLVASCATGINDSPEGEQSVRPGINDAFLAEDLEVEEWVARFEVESREIYAERAAIVASLGLAPGATIADIGAGTGPFLAPFADAVGETGAVYAVEISLVGAANAEKRARIRLGLLGNPERRADRLAQRRR